MKKDTILVTGGCGYIGSHTLIEILTKSNFEVISIDNLSNSSEDAINNIEKITSKRITNYKINLCNESETRKVFEKHLNIVGVIHFAALKSVPESVEKPLLYYHNNLESLLTVLHLAEEFAVKDFIFSSSCSVYGDVSELPVHEETPWSKAASPYAFTKQIGEQIIQDFVANQNVKLNCIALRYFNPVGAHISGLIGENPSNPPTSLVPIITRTAAGIIPQMNVWGDTYPTRDGSCIRDYIHVSDIAEAHLVAMNYLKKVSKTTKFDVFNLGTGKGVSVLEAINAFEHSTGKKLNYKISPPRKGDVISVYSDTSKTEKVLNWKPKYTIEEMMSSAWKWQQNLNEASL